MHVLSGWVQVSPGEAVVEIRQVPSSTPPSALNSSPPAYLHLYHRGHGKVVAVAHTRSIAHNCIGGEGELKSDARMIVLWWTDKD